jgi:hypothetical protein
MVRSSPKQWIGDGSVQTIRYKRDAKHLYDCGLDCAFANTFSEK